MQVIVPRCAALDVHKASITACVRTPTDGGGRAEVARTFAAFHDGLVALRGWLLAAEVTHVAMEATSSYWLPVVRHEALCYRAVWDDRRWPVAAGW